jgi:hypothetical protein
MASTLNVKASAAANSAEPAVNFSYVTFLVPLLKRQALASTQGDVVA